MSLRSNISARHAADLQRFKLPTSPGMFKDRCTDIDNLSPQMLSVLEEQPPDPERLWLPSVVLHAALHRSAASKSSPIKRPVTVAAYPSNSTPVLKVQEQITADQPSSRERAISAPEKMHDTKGPSITFGEDGATSIESPLRTPHSTARSRTLSNAGHLQLPDLIQRPPLNPALSIFTRSNHSAISAASKMSGFSSDFSAFNSETSSLYGEVAPSEKVLESAFVTQRRKPTTVPAALSPSLQPLPSPAALQKMTWFSQLEPHPTDRSQVSRSSSRLGYDPVRDRRESLLTLRKSISSAPSEALPTSEIDDTLLQDLLSTGHRPVSQPSSPRLTADEKKQIMIDQLINEVKQTHSELVQLYLLDMQLEKVPSLFY